MAAESNVGARIFLIGKDAALSGLKEVSAAVAKLNAEIAKGAASSKTAAAGDDEQTAAVIRMNAAMDAYKANLATTTVETDALAKVGKVAFYAIAAAAAVWGYESVKWAQDFQTALTQLQTQAGLTGKAVRAIGSYAEPTAANLGIGPSTYLEAIYHPASAGFGVKQSETITNQAVKLAQIGGSSPTTTVNALTGVMRAYNLTKKGTALKTAAKLNAIIGAGNMHASTLTQALTSGVAASAKTFGVSLTSLGAAMDFMTRQGVSPRKAATYLRMAISRVGAPSAKANTLLKQAGLTTSKILSSDNALSQMLQEDTVTSTQLTRALRTTKGKGGIYNALELLHTTLTKAGLTKSMQASMISSMFGGGRMGTAIDMMYSTLKQLGATSKKVQTSGTTSAFNKDWIKETQTLDFQLKKLGATIEMIGEQFGGKLIPPLTKAVGLFADMLQWLNKSKGVALTLGGVVAAVLVPAIGVYLKRALLSTNGAIMTVIRGYGDLLSGNSKEQLALKRTAEQLTLTADETEKLAQKNGLLAGSASTAAGKIAMETKAEDINVGAADADALAADKDAVAASRFGGASESAAGKIAMEDEAAAGGGLKGAIGGMAGKAMQAGGYTMVGMFAGTIIRGGQSTEVHRGQTLTQGLRSEGGDIAGGAGMGAAIGTIIPGVGTVIGGGVGAGLGALYGVRGQVASDAKGAWDDLFGGGTSKATQKATPIVLHNHVTVEVDGKKVTKSVSKNDQEELGADGMTSTFTIQFRGVSTASTPTVTCSLLGNPSMSRAGGTSASTSSGEGGWQVIDRSRRLAATEWLDYYPFVQTMTCLLNNGSTLTSESVESACRWIESFEAPVAGTHPPMPPLIVVTGPVYHPDYYWVCSRLEFPDTETSVIRNAAGTRVQQKFTIELTQYSPSVAVSASTLSPAQKAQLNSGSPSSLGTLTGGKTYTVKKGDTLQSIAAAQLGTVNLWTQIGILNGLYIGTVLVAGTVLTLPVT